MRTLIQKVWQWLQHQPIYQQRRLLWLASGLCIVLVVVSLICLSRTGTPPVIKPKSIKTPIQTLDPKEIWIHHMEHASKQSDKRIAALEEQLNAFKKEKERASKPKQQMQNAAKPPSPATQLRDVLGQQFNSPQHTPVNNTPPAAMLPKPTLQSDTVLPLSSLSPIKPNTTREPQKPTATGITHIKMPIAARPTSVQKTPHNTLLANTFAPAVLLGSVDALTNLNAASDPKPVLLQITGGGQLPRGGQHDLEGCHVSARAYGELPTERVEMRLETLTCRHRQTGAGMEMDVKGYVSGEDGRPGLRGIVVDRAGSAIRQVGFAGMMNSLSQFFIRQGSQFPTDTPTFNWQQAEGLLKAGAGQGVGNAFEKLAEFFIKRAERLEPVIQIQAGRHVTVVFTQGIPFEDQPNVPPMSPVMHKNNALSPFPTEAT